MCTCNTALRCNLSGAGSADGARRTAQRAGSVDNRDDEDSDDNDDEDSPADSDEYKAEGSDEGSEEGSEEGSDGDSDGGSHGGSDGDSDKGCALPSRSTGAHTAAGELPGTSTAHVVLEFQWWHITRVQHVCTGGGAVCMRHA